MNERIKELWNKTCGEIQPEMDGICMTNQRGQKFAELIVAECVSVSDDYVRGCLCEEHKNIKRPRSTIGRKIKEHFGVK